MQRNRDSNEKRGATGIPDHPSAAPHVVITPLWNRSGDSETCPVSNLPHISHIGHSSHLSKLLRLVSPQ